MSVLGIVLARKGSQGLPGKHLLPLVGRPVIEYTMLHALAAKSVDRVVVSTDDDGVKRLAQTLRLETIDRPASLCSSDASVQSAILHAIDTVEARSAFRVTAVAVLYGNVPVRPLSITDQAVNHLFTTRADSVRSFTPVGKWHPAWMCRLEDDRPVPLVSGSVHRRQDLEKLFLHDGGALVASRRILELARQHPEDPHRFFGDDRRGIVVEPGACIEIDEPRDLYLAEAILRSRGGDHVQVRMAG